MALRTVYMYVVYGVPPGVLPGRHVDLPQKGWGVAEHAVETGLPSPDDPPKNFAQKQSN